jgi:hypothetical protein
MDWPTIGRTARLLPLNHLKPLRIQPGIPHRMLNIPVPQPILNQPRITPLIRQPIPARVPQHMGMKRQRQLRLTGIRNPLQRLTHPDDRC